MSHRGATWKLKPMPKFQDYGAALDGIAPVPRQRELAARQPEDRWFMASLEPLSLQIQDANGNWWERLTSGPL